MRIPLSLRPAPVTCLSLGLLAWQPSCSRDRGACRFDVDCPKLEVCVEGTCLERCPGRPCPADHACLDGRCYPEDCPDRFCPGLGEVCLDEECFPTDCLDVLCPPDQACAAGRCYPHDCQTQVCTGYGEVCVEGQCRQRSCVEVTCPPGDTCAHGLCYPTDCGGGSGACPAGSVCRADECIERSCVGIDCPEGERCANSRCWPQDCPDADCTLEQVCVQGTCTWTWCVESRCECVADADCPGPFATCLRGRCCQAEELPEATCAGGLDEDCDGLVDCRDPDCLDRICDDGDPATWPDTCQSDECQGAACQVEEAPESSCDDGRDNDCDATIDCADPDCSGQACDDGDPTTIDERCQAGTCAGDPCEQVWRCDRCRTDDCRDELIEEDPGCGCVDHVAAPTCSNVGINYDVDCGGGLRCTYERRWIYEDCDCRWECR